ncbi:hypothetical protein Tco_0989054 [Tanacetum coccineum]|uniref:Uncharacterized protein n=1 Tax=Tanacetum coccineum TaxID=301880 RepID=A0ABQ5ETP3_9ASTR
MESSLVKRANLAINGVMVDGDWVDDPCRVKEEFRLHFANRWPLWEPDFQSEVVMRCGVCEKQMPGPEWVLVEFFRKSGYRSKEKQAMVLKSTWLKAYDSIRWDFLEDVLTAFGFGPKWCSWIRGCLHSGMASVLLNGLGRIPIGKLRLALQLETQKPLVGGRLTLFNRFLGRHYLNLPFIKPTKFCASSMESLQGNFFNGFNVIKRKIDGLTGTTALASKKNGGLDSSVAVKLSSVTSSLRRPVRGGSESSQLSLLQEYIEGTILSSLAVCGFWDLNGKVHLESFTNSCKPANIGGVLVSDPSVLFATQKMKT